jgi:hypothetical protein
VVAKATAMAQREDAARSGAVSQIPSKGGAVVGRQSPPGFAWKVVAHRRAAARARVLRARQARPAAPLHSDSGSSAKTMAMKPSSAKHSAHSGWSMLAERLREHRGLAVGGMVRAVVGFELRGAARAVSHPQGIGSSSRPSQRKCTAMKGCRRIQQHARDAPRLVVRLGELANTCEQHGRMLGRPV